jgi:hypothetical protein
MIIKSKENNEMTIKTIYLNGPINSIKIFTISSTKRKDNIFNNLNSKISEKLNIKSNDEINIVIAEAIGRVVLFKNIEKNYFDDYDVLFTDNESILCLDTFDMNCDGLINS